MSRKQPRGDQVSKALELDERRKKVVALRKRGASLADIAATLEISTSTASNDLRAALSSVRDTTDAQDARTLELERLDRMLLAVYPDAIAGDDRKIATVLKLMERRARYLGLDAEPERDTSSPVTVVVNPALFPAAVQQRLAARAEAPITGEEAASDDDDE